MDNSIAQQRQRRWQELLDQVAGEYQQLAPRERAWIAERLAVIADLQGRLQLLVLQADGRQACSQCHGDCCAKGHNHFTLANLLSYLQQGQLPPATDFSAPCPFLGEAGCSLPVAQRPYNCISFICDIIEDRLTSLEVEEYYRLERELRSVYQQFAERYVGGGMTGLLLQQLRLAGQDFLQLKATATG